MEAHPLKDLIEFEAEDNATAAGSHNFYNKVTSEHLNVSTTPGNIPPPRLNFNLNPGGAGGQVVQIREAQMAVETPPKKDLIKLGG